MRISVITPWHNTPELIDGFEAAVSRADEVIIVDNASSPEVATQLLSMTHRLNGKYIRNERNEFVTKAKNQGMREATGDILLFLDSDVQAENQGWLSAVRQDVKPGGLYGPCLAQQLVYGVWWLYFEGWCIGGLAKHFREIQGWDESYTEPYWEDADICTRALAAGLNLVHVGWKLRHLGQGTTAEGKQDSPILKWGFSFEHNRARFAESIKPMAETIHCECWGARQSFGEKPVDIVDSKLSSTGSESSKAV